MKRWEIVCPVFQVPAASSFPSDDFCTSRRFVFTLLCDLASRMFVRYRRCRFSPHASERTCHIVVSAKDMLFRIPFDVSGFLSPARGHVPPILLLLPIEVLFNIEYKFTLSYSGSVSTDSSTQYGPAVLFALRRHVQIQFVEEYGKCCVSPARSSKDPSPLQVLSAVYKILVVPSFHTTPLPSLCGDRIARIHVQTNQPTLHPFAYYALGNEIANKSSK